MIFRIRSNDHDDKHLMANYEKYQDFLKKFIKDEHRDLWSFFAIDFFHDGLIESLNFSKSMQSLALMISCPNIKRKSGDNWSYLKPVWFTCLFEEVVFFQMQTQRIDNFNNPLSGNDCSVLFLESEINTLTEEIAKYNKLYDNTFISMIIKTLPSQRYYSLIFSNLKVEPLEPLAFELMKKNNDFEIPIYK